MGLSMSALICVTHDTVDAVLRGLPKVVRLALGFAARLRRGTLDITLPDGRTLRMGGLEPGPSAAMTLYNYGFASRLVNGGDIGIAEAYLQGEWDTPDLTRFLYLFCVNHDLIQQMLGDRPVMRYVQIARHWLNRNTRRQARRNIYAHYDIGNAFYSAWLDPSMTYSSALFEDDTPDLTAAQNNKYRRLAEAIDLKPGQKLLEIGCGWGGFAEYAAKTYGAELVGLTISREQRDFAQARIQKAGLNEKVEIRLQDYRDVEGTFDRILSIGMFEHVGHRNYRRFFQTVRDRLREDGLFLLHNIGGGRSETGGEPWTEKYIFPNSMIPSARQVCAAFEGIFVLEDWHSFGADYDRTLLAWFRNFDANWNALRGNFDERFRRMWKYYLLSSAGSFRARRNQVWQLVLSPRGVPGGLRVRRLP